MAELILCLIMQALSCIVTWSMVCGILPAVDYSLLMRSSHLADFLLQSGLATQVRFHGKRYPWFVSDVTRKDWNWLLNTMVYGQLFPKASEEEMESLRRLGARWKVCPVHAEMIPKTYMVPYSNMKKRANGFMNNTPFGVPGIPTGICIQKHLIYSSTCRVQIL